MTMPPPPSPVDYAANPARTSPMALWAMILGIAAFPATCLLIGPLLGIVALILGIISLNAINKNPHALAGKGFAITGIVTGASSFLAIPLLIAILLPSLGKARELANRAACAANITGTVKGFVVYANDNFDNFPTAGNTSTFGTYSATLPVLSTATDPDTALTQIQSTPGAVANPTSSIWILVLRFQETPKNLLCKSDPFASSTPSPTTDPSGRYYLTPSAPNQISYSIAYPYDSKTSIGGWWKNNTLSDLPVLSDMSPLDSTGTPTRTLTATSITNNKKWNSSNHNGDGQNVGYADAHCEWRTTPLAGEANDNIFTTSSGSTQHAAAPGTVYPPTTTSPPYDTIMVPLRDATTGAIR